MTLRKKITMVIKNRMLKIEKKGDKGRQIVLIQG